MIWNELQRQLDEKGLKIRKGVIQDATFITADPGHATAGTSRGDDAKTRRNKEGTWTKKGKKSYFGFKLHTKEDCDFGLIRSLLTTTASVHDSQIDLSEEGEVVTGTGVISGRNQTVLMQPCNEVFGGIQWVSGISSEISGSQGFDLLARGSTPSSRMFSMMLMST